MPDSARHIQLCCIRAAACLLVSLGAAAQHKSHVAVFTDVAHSSWTSRDGAPADITALAQTSDGYLWIGTPLGLHRFDGSQFSSYPANDADPAPPGRNITALAADSSGGLWIGDAHGGLSHLQGREISIVKLPHPFEKASLDFLADFAGHLWALTGNSIWTWDGRRWENFAADHGLPQDDFFTLFLDRHGDLWTASRHHVYQLRKSEPRFREIKQEVFSITQFLESGNGTLWISDGWRSVRPLFPRCPAQVVPLKGTAAFEFDSVGKLWIAQDSAGVLRVSGLENACVDAPVIERFDVKSGLSANTTRTLLKDHSGDLWVGTELGLDRFKSRAFLPFLDGQFKFYPALASAPDGTVWIEGHGMPLQHVGLAATGLANAPSKRTFGSSPIAVSPEGDVWLLDPWYHHLHKIDHSNGTDHTFTPPKIFKDTAAQHIAVAPSGAVLVDFEGTGIWQFTKGAWTVFHPSGLPIDLPTALTVSSGNILVGYSKDVLYEVSQSGEKLYGASDGLRVGTLLAFVEDKKQTLWVAGSEGVAFRLGSRFHTLRFTNPNLSVGASGISFDKHANLWINSGAGVVRVSEDEVELARLNPSHAVTAVTFGEADGINGVPAQTKPVPTMVGDGEDRLWIAEAGHVFVVNPDAIDRHQAIPRPSIETVSIDGRPSQFGTKASSPIILRSGRDNKLEINYAGVDLDEPGGDRFRYELEGFDRGWQFADRSREAVYAGLRPGTYTFRLASTNDGEHWSELTSDLEVRVLPSFYQTTWFTLLCALAATLLLWFVYILRIRYVTSRIRDRLEQRTTERLRIARELHDTLLQSIHGLILRFHFATEQLEEEHPARPMLKVALQRADALIVEGRRRVQNLRGEEAEAQSLADALVDMAKDLQGEESTPIRIEEEGVRRSLQAIVREELCKIAHECLVNALRHSDATVIGIELTYGTFSFSFRCRDDGKGIDASVLQAGGRKGHWGIRGIQERARQIGASVSIWSKPGRGTEIEVRVRALSAYASPRFIERLLFRRPPS